MTEDFDLPFPVSDSDLDDLHDLAPLPPAAPARNATELLAPHEVQRLHNLEATVRDGLRDFQRTGQALSEIRDNELFRATHDTFEAYLEERWGFTPSQADRIIEANEVTKVLEPLGIAPISERQARAFKGAAKILTELEPEQQRLVARLAQERQPEGADTDEPAPWEGPPAPELRIMANVVQKMTPDTTVYHPESGSQVALAELGPAERYEVIREQVNQKTQAYQEKQAAKAAAEPDEKVNWASWCMSYAREGLMPGQRLEVVLEHDEKGKPRALARIVDRETGEILAEGSAGKDMKKGVLNLITQMQG